MLLVLFGITWCVLANAPSQLLLLAVAILLRILYVAGARPALPRELLGFWFLVLVAGYFLAEAQLKIRVVMWVCSLVLLGTLILHVGQQTISSGIMQRVPLVRNINLFFDRYMVLVMRQVADMNFWAEQHVRAVRKRNSHRNWPIPSILVAGAYFASRLKIVTSLLHNARALIDGWGAVLGARGGLPSYRLAMLTARRAPRSWYADTVADVALCVLLLLPLSMDNDTLIPRPILELAKSASGMIGR